MAERLDGIVLRELRVRRFGTLRSGRPGTASWSRTTIWGFAALRGGASACGLPGGEWAALLGWSSRAFKVGAWERWLGWLPEQQFRRLHLIAGNTRFLVLPGFRVPNLASRVLGLSARRLSSDMEALRGHLVLLTETFVDPALCGDVLPGRGLAGDWGDAELWPGRGRLAGARPSEEGSGASAAPRQGDALRETSRPG